MVKLIIYFYADHHVFVCKCFSELFIAEGEISGLGFTFLPQWRLSVLAYKWPGLTLGQKVFLSAVRIPFEHLFGPSKLLLVFYISWSTSKWGFLVDSV
jgi:hypothetical protein